MMGNAADCETSLCRAPAAWGNGFVFVSFACTNAPYSSGRSRMFTIHLWNQEALSARVAISPIVPATSGPPSVAKPFSVAERE